MLRGTKLPIEMVELIRVCTAGLGAAATEIMAQAERALVVRASGTDVELQLPEDMDLMDLPDGPTPGRSFVYVGDTMASEVEVWVRAGRLIALEQTWYADEPPTDWPSADRVRWEP